MSYSPLASPQPQQFDVSTNLLNMLKPGGSGLTTPTDLNNDLFISNAQHLLNELFLSRIQPMPNNGFSSHLLSPTSMSQPSFDSLIKQNQNSDQMTNAYHDHLMNSTINELEESLINNYFNHSSFSSSSSSSLSNENQADKANLSGPLNPAQAQCDDSSLIISQINNLTL